MKNARIVYNSDPSTIASHVLPDPVEADDLRHWTDMLADSGVDVFVQDAVNQGFTIYWRSDRFQYDLRPQHERFLPLLDAGTQPLQVLRDRSHERGMTFLAGIRMNDGHDFPVFADFIESHPDWQLPKRWDVLGIQRPPEASINVGGKRLDYTVDEVRAFYCEMMEDLLDCVCVDGLELIFRESYFPVPDARDHAHLMTDMVRRVRVILDDRSRLTGTRLILGVRVYANLEECLLMGLDVPTWIGEGLIDYCCPMDTMFSDFNARYAEFGALAQDSKCRMYPGLHPWTSHRMRLKSAMTPAMCRALAHTFYAAGADGISIFNHFVGHLWLPPCYPQALQVFHDLRDPQRVARGERHYVFDPTWGGVPWMGWDRCQSGIVNAQRVSLDRKADLPSGIFHFRLYEQMDRVGATLLLRGANLTAQDELEVTLNGVPLNPGPFGREDARAHDKCPDTRWFPLPENAPAFGDNQLSMALVASDSDAGDLIIDEVEIFVQPH